MFDVATIPLFVPFFLLAMALVPRSFGARRPDVVVRAVVALTFSSVLTALLCALILLTRGTIQHQFLALGPFHLGVYFDALSATFLALISFLGAVVARFSVNYLAGEPDIGRFFKWLGVTTGAALLLVVVGNLVMFTLAWMAMSLSLHKLLTFYPHRRGAMVAAHKKFVISRLGDACLLGAIVLVYRQFGTWDFGALFAQAHQMAAQGAVSGGQISALGLLLVAGAMLKSAQFPFHSWLPDTMETPTPVSALMHAGIINAGGILVVRLSPLISLTPLALDVLATVGAFTAVFAGIVMTTQTSIKRSLAFSTIGQMGFMLLQCGLGAFSVAVLHIVAHSLYKAFAFLSSGSVIASKTGAVRPNSGAPSPVLSLFCLGVALLLTFGMALSMGISPRHEAGALLLSAILMLALTNYLLCLWSNRLTAPLALIGLAIGAGVSALYFTLHLAFARWLQPVLPVAPPRGIEMVLLAGVALGGVFWMAPFLRAAPRGEISRGENWRRDLYVHASNGFYLNTLANRLIARR